MHTRAAPRERLQDPDLYGDVTARGARLPARARSRWRSRAGVAPRAADRRPGPGLRQDARADDRAARASVGRLHELGRPLLMAISRKDFIGALTGRAPRERLAGHAGRARPRRRTRARTSSASTTSPPPPTSSPCARRSPASVEPSRDLALAEELRHDRSPRTAALSEPRWAAGRVARLSRIHGCRPLSNAAGRQPPIHHEGEGTPDGSTRALRAGGKSLWPTCTRSPTSSASTASGACARPS